MLKDEEGFDAPLPDDQSLYYLQQILEGVSFLHQSGFVHLDIKSIYLLIFVLMHNYNLGWLSMARNESCFLISVSLCVGVL